MLPLFWQHFEKIEPGNKAFDEFKAGRLNPARTIPMVIHGDEGRGRKRSGIMIVNGHGVIGRGTQPFLNRHADLPQVRDLKAGINLKGHSLSTRFLAFVLPKTMYGSDAANLHRMLNEVAQEYAALQKRGLTMNNEIWHIVCIGLCGDLPFHGKVAGLTRTFSRCVKKTGQIKNGICHLCTAGEPEVNFEDFNDDAVWMSTVGSLPHPWKTMPEILKVLSTDRFNIPAFLRLDIWHCMHLGAGRAFVSSAIAEILPSLPGYWFIAVLVN